MNEAHDLLHARGLQLLLRDIAMFLRAVITASLAEGSTALNPVNHWNINDSILVTTYVFYPSKPYQRRHETGIVC